MVLPMSDHKISVGCFIYIFAVPTFLGSLAGLYYGHRASDHEDPQVAESAAELWNISLFLLIVSAIVILLSRFLFRLQMKNKPF